LHLPSRRRAARPRPDEKARHPFFRLSSGQALTTMRQIIKLISSGIYVLLYNIMARKASRFDLDDALGYLLYQASGAIRDRIGRELVRKGYPITVEEFTALILIWDQDGEPQSALAKRLHRDRAFVTRLISDIESRGFVQRIPGKDDGRKKRLFLTEKGKKLMDDVTALISEILRFAGRGIPPEEMAACKDVLRRVLLNLK